MQITASVRLARSGVAAGTHTHTFSALPSGLRELTDWLLEHRVSATLRPEARFVLQDQLAAFDNAHARIAQYDAFIRQHLAPYRSQLDLLMTLPGIDHAAARALLIELGPEVKVFPSARHCAAWAGLCPGNHESAAIVGYPDSIRTTIRPGSWQSEPSKLVRQACQRNRSNPVVHAVRASAGVDDVQAFELQHFQCCKH